MTAIGFVILVCACIVARLRQPDPNNIPEVIAYICKRKGNFDLFLGLMVLLGLVLIVAGLAIKLWEILP